MLDSGLLSGFSSGCWLLGLGSLCLRIGWLVEGFRFQHPLRLGSEPFKSGLSFGILFIFPLLVKNQSSK